jgi:hypothetical protein
MKEFANVVNGMGFELNEKGEMKQNVRNAFKADVMGALFEMFQEAGLEVAEVEGGVAVNFQNAEVGSVAVVFNGVVKGFDFDFEYEAQALADAKAAKVVKAEAAAKAKAEKIAMQKAEKEMKANAKAKKA